MLEIHVSTWLLSESSPEKASWWKEGICVKIMYIKGCKSGMSKMSTFSLVCVWINLLLSALNKVQTTNLQIYSNERYNPFARSLKSTVAVRRLQSWRLHYDRVEQQVSVGWGCALSNPIDLTQQCGNVEIWTPALKPFSAAQPMGCLREGHNAELCLHRHGGRGHTSEGSAASHVKQVIHVTM